jgi:hypothetical protein
MNWLAFSIWVYIWHDCMFPLLQSFVFWVFLMRNILLIFVDLKQILPWNLKTITYQTNKFALQTEGQCCSTITATQKSANATSANKQIEVISFGPATITRQQGILIIWCINDILIYSKLCLASSAGYTQISRWHGESRMWYVCLFIYYYLLLINSESACPYNQVLRNGICVDYTLRLRDSPIEGFQ